MMTLLNVAIDRLWKKAIYMRFLGQSHCLQRRTPAN